MLVELPIDISDYQCKQGAKANVKARSILVKRHTKQVKTQLMAMNSSWNKVEEWSETNYAPLARLCLKLPLWTTFVVKLTITLTLFVNSNRYTNREEAFPSAQNPVGNSGDNYNNDDITINATDRLEIRNTDEQIYGREMTRWRKVQTTDDLWPFETK